MHYSAGAVVERDGKFLLIDRASPPFGFAAPAGHVDEEESPVEAVAREVREETGLAVVRSEVVGEGLVAWNVCSKGVRGHYWYVFRCDVEGELRRSERETKSAGWYARDVLKGLRWEPVWEYWFRKLKLV